MPQPPDEAMAALGQALAAADLPRALRPVVAHWPELIDGWAHLGQATWRAGDSVAAYAFARTGYHRGLDTLRRHGGAGTGLVRWERQENRGFLRSVHLLLVCAAAIGEVQEAVRCRNFLLDLDPEDGIGAASIPDQPLPGWSPDQFP
ncbi:MAG: DUF3151 family protein [Candidatus Dormibacteria bacterium]